MGDMAEAHHATRRFRWSFAALLAAFSALGPFSIDAYLPAFAGIQTSLDATPLEIQQTLSAYLFAFGLMFLFHGALSDSFGRRPVILVALAIYTIASIGAALAASVHALIAWRIVQGLSVGAGMVVGRAMIRDLFGPEDAQRLMSVVTLFFGLAPAVAPVIGGWLFVGLGWRSVFWFLAGLGVLLVGVGWRYLPETHGVASRQPFHPVALLKGYEEVGIHARFLLLSLTAGFNFNAFFLYIVSAPVFLGDKVTASHTSGTAGVGILPRTAAELRALLERYFHVVFSFSIVDDIVHPGTIRAADYIFALCCYRKP